MSKRSDYIPLADMLDALEAIQEYTTGLTYDSFLSSRMVRDAVARTIQVLGEAANRISKEFRDKHQTIEWIRIITVHLPDLHQTINYILVSDPPESAAIEPM